MIGNMLHHQISKQDVFLPANNFAMMLILFIIIKKYYYKIYLYTIKSTVEYQQRQ